jgi:hypothetical protein
MIDNERSIPIIATNNQIYGEVHLNIVPCEEDGNSDLNEDLLPDDPMDLIG